MTPAGRVWLLLSVLLALGALLGASGTASHWNWQPALAWGEPWRWWTAAFVHLNAGHLAANLAGLALVAAWGRVAQVPADVSLGWLATWPLTHLALLFKPALSSYGGLSGVLHGGVAVVATWLLSTRAGLQRWIGGAVLGGLVVKLIFEAPWGPAVVLPAGSTLAVAPLAHAAGAVLGVGVTLLVLARRPVREPSTP